MCDSEEQEMESRHISLCGQLEEEAVAEVISSIHDLTVEAGDKPIHLHIIACSGGSTLLAMGLIDVMQARHTAPVHTYAWGEAISMGAFILAAGKERRVGANAMVMVHASSASAGSPTTRGLVGSAAAVQEHEVAMFEWLDDMTGDEPGTWTERVCQCAVWMDAQEAVEEGLADWVVEAKH